MIHGKTIELDREPGLDDGPEVSVEIRPIVLEATQTDQPASPWWLEQLDVDPTVRRGKFVVKGTTLLADALVDQLDIGKTDSELLQAHPELTNLDASDAVGHARAVGNPVSSCAPRQDRAGMHMAGVR